MVLTGLSVFLSKVWSERIARREGESRDMRITELRAQLDQQVSEIRIRLDAAMQKAVHVSKLQFEHEYEIYKQAWEQLFALRQATLSLRPQLDDVDPNESDESRMRKRIAAFRTPYNAFLDVIEKNKPFYPPVIYDALSDVREKCRHEVIEYENLDSRKLDYYIDAMKNHARIIELIEVACTAIRNRITEVSVQ